MCMIKGLLAATLTSGLFVSTAGGAIAQSTITPDTTPVVTDMNDDDGFDLGWLGLIGLIGLAGLRGRKDVPRDTIR